jgi:hypothetical protein
VAANRICPVLAIVTLPGCTLTTTWGKTVTLAEALGVVIAGLVAVMVTGSGDGTPAGAT